jgi:hypothetical protein
MPCEQWSRSADLTPLDGGAPIVIAYRNGKPRFCVDYRKLNAVTIADEFPLQIDLTTSLSNLGLRSVLHTHPRAYSRSLIFIPRQLRAIHWFPDDLNTATLGLNANA